MRCDKNFEFVKGMLTNDEVDIKEQEKEAQPCGGAELLLEMRVEL
jgi:hypothetical protein